MAPSPDGKRLATSDGSGGLQLWDLSSGTRVRDIDTAPNRAEAPTFSPDSTLLAAADSHAGSSSPDGFSIWEVATGRRLTRLPMEPRFSGLRGAFLPGEGFLGFGSGAETSPESVGQLWSLADDRSKPRLLERFERPTNMDSVAAGGGLVTLETDSRLLLRDVRTGKGTRHFDVKTTSQIVKAYACARGEDVVAAVLSPGEKLNLWNGHTGELLASHQAPEGLAGLNFSPNGTTLAGVDMRGDVHLIDCVTGVTHRVRPEESDRARLARVVFSPDSARLATNVFVPGQAGSPVSIWQTGTGRRLATFSGRPEPVAQAEFTTDSQSLLILSKSGIRQWRLAPADDDTNRQPAGHEDEAWSLAFSPDGRMLATGGDDDSGPDPTVKLWDTTTGRLSRAWHGGHGTVAALAISPDGRTLATGHLVSTDNVRIWDTATGRLLTTLTGHADRVRTVAFPRDGGSLATAGSDGTVRLWDVRSWCVRTVFRGHGDTVHAVAYSPDGATLASAGDNGDLRLWDLRSNKGAPSPPRLFPGRSNLVAVAFAPDGKTLAVADDQGTMTVWDLERSTPLRLIQSEGGALCQVTYAPDGDALAAAGKDGLIRLWDPATGQELISLAAHRAPIHGLAFSPDGSTLGSVAHDGSVRLWRADP
jgi:WD40 repeat protein